MITSAYLIKAMSFLGFKPQIDQCIGCGKKVIGGITQPGELVNFSFLEGGITCSVCSHDFETQWVKGEVIQWIYTLLYLTFEQILTFQFMIRFNTTCCDFFNSGSKSILAIHSNL